MRASNSFLPASYYSINNGGFSAGTGTIPHSQGFIFKSTSGTDQTLNFNLSHLTTTDPTFYKSVNGLNKHLNIILSNSNNFTDKARIFADSPFQMIMILEKIVSNYSVCTQIIHQTFIFLITNKI